MIQISKKQALIYSILFLVISTVLEYFFPGNRILNAGLLIVILFTVFIPGNTITNLVTITAAIVIGVLAIEQYGFFDSGYAVINFAFSMVLILFTFLLVLYLKNLHYHLKLDRTHMTSLFENATEGIILTNKNGEILLFNPAAEKMFGYQKDELLGEPIEVLLPPEFRKHHVGLRSGFNKNPENRSMGIGRELFAIKKDGTRFNVEISLGHYHQSNQLFIIAFIIDITRRKEIEQSVKEKQQELEMVSNDLRQLNTELEDRVEERTQILQEALKKLEKSQKELNDALGKERELNEIKSRFVSMASHEFRTPLSTVLSSASLLSKYVNTEEQDKRNKHINRIRESVRHLNDILEDFLSLGKLNEGKIEADRAHFNICEVIEETVDDMRLTLKKEQHIKYSHEGEKNIYSDKRLIKNILINLIGNAIKFSEEGKEILVKSLVENSKLSLSVMDKGIGISDQDQQHLFSSFFRAQNALNIQGTGLGLHIVKRYVDLLKGKINLQSALNRGTTITIEIPTENNSSL